jgi:hypothetical protein
VGKTWRSPPITRKKLNKELEQAGHRVVPIKKTQWIICRHCNGIGCDFCDGGAVIRTEKEND